MNTNNTNAISNSPAAMAGIARSAVLVDFTMRVFTGRRRDRVTQDEVTAAKNAKSKRAASVSKSLFADCAELDAIIKHQAQVRKLHYKLTLPWADGGARLLPIVSQMRYAQTMDAARSEFDTLVTRFLDRYDTLVAASAFNLGELFDRSEYPTRNRVSRQFAIAVSYSPLPLAGDFRIDAESDIQKHLISQYEERATSAVAAAQRDAWTRLHTELKHIVDRLTDKDGKKNKIFDSLLTNPLELCGLLTAFNVTNDPALEVARRRLENTLMGVTTDDLRKSADARVEVRTTVAQILADNDWSMIDDDAQEADAGAQEEV